MARELVRDFKIHNQYQEVGYVSHDDWVDKLIALDKMELSDSPWNTPVFVVPKPKSDGYRIVNDFRGLNQRTKRAEWPLPIVQYALDSLGGSTYFTQIDLSDGSKEPGAVWGHGSEFIER